ncbi:hypothetical protein AUEXF2481DRAFT_1060 [Aureobasidium subglaciale EXF-2481]|uniref:Uncharacterized protein n=1 Tax=Aureobasidium subglaciale (strain EXF-2481) TaxID=1043005 RepID=A0A074YTT7_AURSE|nr:uncharacterized protein AUEXF2481DRAFT_1060 [Aureobasidium subglaciale EXF-2481]KEQ99564.1 hypothetical protein AUEXF2481DRAFT_1060 [Aureobasidium subglaciale EXF-2481]
MDSFNRFVAEHAEEDSRVFTQALNMFGIASDGYLNNVKDHVTKLAKDFDIKVREPQCAQSSSGPDHSARLQATLESEVHRAELLEQKLMVKEELLNKSLIHTRDLEHRLDQEQRQNCKLLDNYRKEYSRSLELAQRLNKKVEAAWFVQEQINEAGQIETTLVKELADTRADIEDLEEEDTLREATISDFVCWVHTAGHKALHQALNKFWEHISSDLLDHERETDHYNEELPVPSSQVGSIPKDSAVADNVDNLTGSHDDSERCSSNDSTFTTFRKWISARIARSQASEKGASSLEHQTKTVNIEHHHQQSTSSFEHQSPTSERQFKSKASTQRLSSSTSETFINININFNDYQIQPRLHQLSASTMATSSMAPRITSTSSPSTPSTHTAKKLTFHNNNISTKTTNHNTSHRRPCKDQELYGVALAKQKLWQEHRVFALGQCVRFDDDDEEQDDDESDDSDEQGKEEVRERWGFEGMRKELEMLERVCFAKSFRVREVKFAGEGEQEMDE